MWNLIVSSASVATSFSVVVVVEVVVVEVVVVEVVVVEVVVVEVVVVEVVVVEVVVVVDWVEGGGIVVISIHSSSSLLHRGLVVVTTSD